MWNGKNTKTRVRVSRCAQCRDDTMPFVFEKATCVWCWGHVKRLSSFNEQRGKTVVLKLLLGCIFFSFFPAGEVVSSVTPATFWISVARWIRSGKEEETTEVKGVFVCVQQTLLKRCMQISMRIGVFWFFSACLSESFSGRKNTIKGNEVLREACNNRW